MRVLYKGKKEILKYGHGDMTIEFFSGKEKTVPKDVGEILVTNCSSDFERVMQPEKDDADAVIDLDEEKEEIPDPPYECECGKKYTLKAHYQHYLKHIENCPGNVEDSLTTSWGKEQDDAS